MLTSEDSRGYNPACPSETGCLQDPGCGSLCIVHLRDTLSEFLPRQETCIRHNVRERCQEKSCVPTLMAVHHCARRIIVHAVCQVYEAEWRDLLERRVSGFSCKRDRSYEQPGQQVIVEEQTLGPAAPLPATLSSRKGSKGGCPIISGRRSKIIGPPSA